MPNRDLAHEWTDEELERLERRIARVYREARDDLQETIDAYFDRFKERDEEMKSLIGTIQNGKEWTEEDYKQWRLNQIGRGKRFEALRDKIAERMTEANEVAISYVNDATPSIYSMNRNYAAYAIEQVSGSAGFTLIDESTVRRMLVDEPNLMPNYPEAKAVKRGIDLAWGKKQITSSVTSGILQGNSVGKIANDLQKRITTMNRESAVRAARTAVTGAQNAGRLDTYVAADRIGIKTRKEWVATMDSRTRHSHRRLDGEIVDYDDRFSNGCRYPGDPRGRPAEVYNCRCTMVAVVDGVDTSDAQRVARNPDTGRNVKIENMTYAQWSGWKENIRKGKQISTVEELTSYAESIFRDQGVTVGEMAVGNFIEPAKETVDTIKDLLNEFNSTMKTFSIQNVMVSGESGATVWASKTSSAMRISPTSLRKNAAIADTLNVGEKKNLVTPVHEFAHTLSSKSMDIDKSFWDEIEKIRRAYRKNIRDIEKAEYVSHTMDAAQAKDAKDAIFISEYANKNVEEFMAESFAQAYLSENPSKYAENVLQVIRKYFGK